MNLKKEIIGTLSRCVDFGDPEEYYEKLTKKGQEFDDKKTKNQMISVLEALGSQDRIKILHFLRKKDRCVCELEAILQKSQAAVSHHLKILQDAKLIQGWKKGKFTHYSLVKQKVEELLKKLSQWFADASNWFTVDNIIG